MSVLLGESVLEQACHWGFGTSCPVAGMREGLLGKRKCDQPKHETERKWMPENSKHSRWMQRAVLEGEGLESHLSSGQLQAQEQSEQQTGDCRHCQVTLKPQHMLVGGRWSDSVWKNPQGELPVSHDSLAYLLSANRSGVEGGSYLVLFLPDVFLKLPTIMYRE